MASQEEKIAVECSVRTPTRSSRRSDGGGGEPYSLLAQSACSNWIVGVVEAWDTCSGMNGVGGSKRDDWIGFFGVPYFTFLYLTYMYSTLCACNPQYASNISRVRSVVGLSHVQ